MTMTKPTRALLLALLSTTPVAACGDDGDGTCVADCAEPDGGADAGLVECASVGDFCPTFQGKLAIVDGPSRWGMRVPLPATPYRVETIRYSLGAGISDIAYDFGRPTCDPVRPHVVELYVSPSGNEVPVPPAVREILVEEDPDATSGRDVELSLDPPLEVAEGEDFYFTLVAGPGREVNLCVRACPAIDDPRLPILSGIGTTEAWFVQADVFGAGGASNLDVVVEGSCMAD